MKVTAILLCLILLGCGGGTDPARESADTKESKEKKEGIFDPLVQSLDKAKGVEDTVMEQKAQTDQALLEAEGEADEDDD